jgi:predicted transcriptional regulator
MKPLRKTPDDEALVRILKLARKGESKERIAEAILLPDTQFRRHMAALVDRGFLTFDRRKKVWITTDKGHRFLKF